MSANKNILIVAPDFPYPPNHGGRVDVWQRMLVLKEMGYDLDLLVSVKIQPESSDIDAVKKVVGRLMIVPRGKTWEGMFGWRPHQVNNRRALSHHPLENKYFVVLIEGTPCEAAMRNPALCADYVILRVHNDESLYFWKLALSTRNFVKALYYFIESLRFAINDHFLFRKLKHFLFISLDEYSKFKKSAHSKHAIFLPPVITNVSKERSHAKSQPNKRVLFVGSLFMPNNRDGLIWYIKNVHPRLRHIKGYRLVVAGNSKGDSLDWLAKGPYGDEIEVHDTPPTLDSLYDSAAVFINPMRFGAGMKIKTVEALCHGLPMVSTTTGLEGTGFKDGVHLYQADGPKLFADRVEKILEHPDVGEGLLAEALKYIDTEFNAAKKLKAFMAELNQG